MTAPSSDPRLRRWTPPDFSDLDRLARTIEARCPDAAPVGPLRVLGEGFFSVAVATASGFVFRLGTSPDVFERYQKEWRILPWLARQDLPAAVPAPRWLLAPDAALPFGGIGYPLIEGRTLTLADTEGPHGAALAEQIAAFNLSLHRLPIEEAFALGAPDGREVERAWHDADRAVSLQALAGVLGPKELASVEAWWRRFLRHSEQRSYVARMSHSDIGDGNTLVDPSGVRLVGIIDWEHSAVGDPSADFDGLVDLGRAFRDEAVAAYEKMGGRLPPGTHDDFEWRRQRGAFPAVRRAWQRGDLLDPEAIRARLRRHGVLD